MMMVTLMTQGKRKRVIDGAVADDDHDDVADDGDDEDNEDNDDDVDNLAGCAKKRERHH